MATLCRTGAPSWKVIAWVDDSHIYIEIPSTEGNPYIQKYLLSEGALSKALNFLRTRYELVPSAEKNYTRDPADPGYVCESGGAGVKYRRQTKVVQTDAERALALNVLRKMGIV